MKKSTNNDDDDDDNGDNYDNDDDDIAQGGDPKSQEFSQLARIELQMNCKYFSKTINVDTGLNHEQIEQNCGN